MGLMAEVGVDTESLTPSVHSRGAGVERKTDSEKEEVVVVGDVEAVVVVRRGDAAEEAGGEGAARARREAVAGEVVQVVHRQSLPGRVHHSDCDWQKIFDYY